jgi:hypothetical protein
MNWRKRILLVLEQVHSFRSPLQVQAVGSLGTHKIAPGVKKRKRSPTPEEQIHSSDKAEYVEQEKRAAKRMAEDDPDYADIYNSSRIM